MHIIDDLPRDRGSKYAVSGGPARSKAEAQAFIRALTREKRFAKATHNSWALLI
ncbi:YigZ family protein, partial [Thioclava sp. BHET1]